MSPQISRAPGNAGRARLPKPEASPIIEAQLIWREGRPIGGTLAERYLEAYGCTSSFADFPTLRFREGRPPICPAIVAAVQAPDGRLTAVELTVLHPSGSRLADIEKPKIVLGKLGDGAVRFARASADTDVCITIEDAVLSTQRGWQVWASITPERRGRVAATLDEAA